MTDSRPIHELAPMTDSSAELLASYYGFPTVDALAADLPQNAVVMDVGAGLSDFGTEVAKRRPDVRWLNYDLHYDQETLQGIGKTALSNLEFMQGDVLQASNVIQPESVDRIFTYAMVPHLELTDTAVAEKAIKEMSKLLKEDGKLYIGQGFSERKHGSKERRGASLVITAQEFKSRGQAVINEALERIKIKGITRWTTRKMNTYGYDFFGQRIWMSNPDRAMATGKIWDKTQNKFVPLTSLSGLKITSRFGIHIAKGLTRQALKRQK